MKYIKTSIRAKVERPFRIIKHQFGFRKVDYLGFKKNDNKPAKPFVLVNLFKIEQMK